VEEDVAAVPERDSPELEPDYPVLDYPPPLQRPRPLLLLMQDEAERRMAG